MTAPGMPNMHLVKSCKLAVRVKRYREDLFDWLKSSDYGEQFTLLFTLLMVIKVLQRSVDD